MAIGVMTHDSRSFTRGKFVLISINDHVLHLHVCDCGRTTQNLQGCLEDNGDDTYNTTGCKTWCRTGSIRVEGAYGIPGVVLSSPHFLYGDEDIYMVRFGFILRRTILKLLFS